MKGYSEVAVFTHHELALLREAKKIVKHLPTWDRQGRWVRCHEVARLVGAMLGLTVQDGHYGITEHSWLWTPHQCHGAAHALHWNVLDCYAVGRLPGVQLVAYSVAPIERAAYQAGKPRRDVRPSVMQQLYTAVKEGRL